VRKDDGVTDEHPELRDYESSDRPLRSPHLIKVMRVVVVLGIVALVLPGIVTTMSVASSTAQAACEQWVAYAVDGPSGARVSFELFAAGGAGWQCYSDGAFGEDRYIAPLGLIPGPPRIPTGPTVTS
jgi:hypothetical protein